MNLLFYIEYIYIIFKFLLQRYVVVSVNASPPCTFNLIQTELYSNYMVAVAIAED